MLSKLSCATIGRQVPERLNVGIDMGKRKWAVDVLDTRSGRHQARTFTGDDCADKTYSLIAELRKTNRDVDVIYEAGRNGFTPARCMAAMGASVAILPVNKLQVVKAGKKAKTDGLDARELSERDARDPALPRVWVPPTDAECRRQMIREQQRLKKDIRRNNSRILSIMERWPVGCTHGHRSVATWCRQLAEWEQDGTVPRSLPRSEVLIIISLVRELKALEQNQTEWEEQIARERKQQRRKAAQADRPADIDVLQQYKGLGEETVTNLCWHVGDFSRFSSGKKFAAYIGLVPVPWQSGMMNKCQGISKAGSPALRRLMVELAWLWVRYQPDSVITRKWAPRLAEKGRSRKKAIVAVARQLAVALLQRLNHGIELEGAIKNKPLASLS